MSEAKPPEHRPTKKEQVAGAMGLLALLLGVVLFLYVMGWMGWLGLAGPRR